MSQNMSGFVYSNQKDYCGQDMCRIEQLRALKKTVNKKWNRRDMRVREGRRNKER